ncbi:hypothetical protein LXL04_026485 [Taraxacum kok-saghyz]
MVSAGSRVLRLWNLPSSSIFCFPALLLLLRSRILLSRSIIKIQFANGQSSQFWIISQGFCFHIKCLRRPGFVSISGLIITASSCINWVYVHKGTTPTSPRLHHHRSSTPSPSVVVFRPQETPSSSAAAAASSLCPAYSPSLHLAALCVSISLANSVSLPFSYSFSVSILSVSFSFLGSVEYPQEERSERFLILLF